MEAIIQQQQSNLFEICKDKPFWIWNIEAHRIEANAQVD
jgi:hypothetical protein